MFRALGLGEFVTADRVSENLTPEANSDNLRSPRTMGWLAEPAMQRFPPVPASTDEYKNMTLDGSIAAILAQLTTEERNGGAVYVATELIRARTTLEFPKTRVEVKWDALLAFVDRDPMANWSHSCRYVLLNTETHAVESFEAALPPFSNKSLHWRVAYKAPSVPDALLAVAR